MKKLFLLVCVLSVSLGLASLPTFGQTVAFPGPGMSASSGLTLNPGWTYLQDTGSLNCAAGTSSCTVSAFIPTTAGSVWGVVIQTGNTSSITTTVTGGGGSWSHCTSCHLSTSNDVVDAWTNVTGTAGTTQVTVTLSANAVGYFFVAFLEGLPPAGYTASFDVGNAVANSSCSTSCNGAALSITGTDLVFEVHDPGSYTAGPFAWSSPYITDTDGDGVYLNATSGTAPAVSQGSASYDSVVGLAFKSTANSFTGPTPLFTMQNVVTTNAVALNCSPTCSLTVPSTGTGHLLFLVSGGEAGQYISRTTVPTGAGTWVVPTACEGLVTASSINYTISCAYVLSSTSGATSISITMSASASDVGFAYFEVARSSGSFAVDTIPSANNNSASFTPGGVAFTLSGTNDALFQVIMCPGGAETASLYPYYWQHPDGSEFLTNNGSAQALLNSANGTAPLWINPQNNATVVIGAAFK